VLGHECRESEGRQEEVCKTLFEGNGMKKKLNANT
jgi:hypothetical protein